MVDWQSIVISGLVAFGVSFLVVYARYILIDKRQYERVERRKTVMDRLEKLYTPLFTLIETIQAIHPNLITYEDIFKFEIDKPHRATFDKAIEQYNYLASDTLAPLLYKIHKSSLVFVIL